MESRECLVLHPNAAVHNKTESVQLELCNGAFETSFFLGEKEGIVTSSLDASATNKGVRLDEIELRDIFNMEMKSIVETKRGKSVTGKIVKQYNHDDAMAVVLEIFSDDNQCSHELTLTEVVSIEKLSPVYSILVRGRMVKSNFNIVMLHSDVNLRYAISTIKTAVRYNLYLAGSAATSQLQQTLFVRNDSKTPFECKLCYNPVDYPTGFEVARANYYAESARSMPEPSFSATLLRQETIALGVRKLGEETTLPVMSFEIPNLAIDFKLFIPLPEGTKDAEAMPHIRIPLVDEKLVDGSLNIYDDKGYFLTSGQLKAQPGMAMANLTPLNYGVRVTAEPNFEPSKVTENILASILLEYQNGNEGRVALILRFPSIVRIGRYSYATEFQKTTLKIPSGESTERIKLMLDKLE